MSDYPWYGLADGDDLQQGDLLLECPCLLAERPTDFLVIDFRMQFATEYSQLKLLASRQKPRLRLLPPYREHLAQALARFYMRVGLPVDIAPF